MVILLKSLWSRAWGYVLAAAAVLMAVFAIRQSGKNQARTDQIEDAIKSMRKSNENREEVSRMDDDTQLDEFDRLWNARRK